jgi:hypothetical protein
MSVRMSQQVIHSLLSLSDKNIPVLRMRQLWASEFAAASGTDRKLKPAAERIEVKVISAI